MTLHHDKRTHKQQRFGSLIPEKNISKICFLGGGLMFGTRLQARDELEQTSPSRLARKDIVMDPVGCSQGAQKCGDMSKKCSTKNSNICYPK